ncbi:Protein takeout [Frankliniella fusca]|uniref:Protein takeout n=1 Tax=Frankliniella fusca TaxID=407009 RepID=A0AAE1HU14_9NEOP|nr:Protein takeout [Frankliniella fusca]
MARYFTCGALALILVVCYADALKLPSYIKACKRDDPKLNECALKNGREAVSRFVNGDRKYKIPNLNPLTLYNFGVDSGSSSVGIKLTFKEAQIHGLGEVDIRATKLDLEKKHIEFDLFWDVFYILGDYEISGRVLVLPITGKGPANITVTNLVVTFGFDYELVPKKKAGKEYVSLTSSNVKFEVGRAYFDLKNLFNGDRLLGDNMNQFLNENWREVTKELGPSLADSIGAVIRQIIQQIVDVVPYDNIFLAN